MMGPVWGPLGTLNPICLESKTPEAYTSESCLFSSVVLYRPVMEPGGAWMPEGNPAGDAPPFHSNNKLIPFHLGSSRHFFLQAVSEQV